MPASALRIALCDSHHLFRLPYAFTSSNLDACEVASSARNAHVN